MTLRLGPPRFYYRLCLYSLPALSFAVAAYLRFFSSGFRNQPPDRDPDFYLIILALTTAVWSIAIERAGLCEIEGLFREYTGIRKTFSACATTYVSVAFLTFFYRGHNLSRAFFVMSAVLLFVSCLFSRLLFRNLLRRRVFSASRIRVLMVGADRHAMTIANRLRKVPFANLEVVGHVRLPSQDVTVKELPVFDLDLLEKQISVSFEEIIIAAPPSQLHSLSQIVSKLDKFSVPIRTVLDLGTIALIRERLFQFADIQMLDITPSPADSPHYFALKRAFDLVFSVLAVLFTAPLMLLISILIKLSSRGPVFFKQVRVGLNGRHFTMYKFRTMRESDVAESDTCWTTAADGRRTMIGTLLRKTSLDELPQFFNVLRGDMSVVGPRPERPHFVQRFLSEITHYNSRHRLKVGITGWAQVNGWRGDTSIQKRFEFDLYYLQNWSFWFDLRIIFLTAWSGMFGKNAY